MGNFFDSNIDSGDIYQIDVKNAKVDMVKIDKGSTTTYNSTQQTWGLYSLLLCHFYDTILESGNIGLNGMPIEYIRIKKRRDNQTTWTKYKDIPFITGQSNYEWNDYFVQSNTSWEYAILPVGAGGIEGEQGIQSIDCEYDDLFILGSDGTQFKLQANINLSDIQNCSESNYITTLGSKYPIEIRNSLLNYKKTSIKAMLVSDSTMNNYGKIDKKAENELRENIYDFLTNGKPKVLKDSSGLYLLISISPNSVKITPNNDLSRNIAEISMDVTEVGDVYNYNYLYTSGFVN